ncbi:MAG: hypothetical protein NTV52_08075 [Acidobacteria bacterium]|nr:hypothetical protein [Acidobacteriota bacterium]
MITLQLDHAATAPGELITGLAQWRLTAPPETLEVRLVWKTAGKGDVDMANVPLLQVPLSGHPGQLKISFPAPLGPWSYSGSLFSIAWILELTLSTRDGELARSEHPIVIAPHRRA